MFITLPMMMMLYVKNWDVTIVHTFVPCQETQENNNDDDDLVECHVSSEEHAVITYIQVDAGSIEVWKKSKMIFFVFLRHHDHHCRICVHFKKPWLEEETEYRIQFDL